ncbi:hypothetical protein ES705_33240 [subsurface metagenome]
MAQISKQVADNLLAGTRQPGTSIRAERTPEAVAVSGVNGEAGEASAWLEKSPKVVRLSNEVTTPLVSSNFPGFPKTNLELPLPRGGFSIERLGNLADLAGRTGPGEPGAFLYSQLSSLITETVERIE